MERRHQVFVSSTYDDLVIERQQVIQALLELDCIPAGMELFPAADEDSWSLIKEIIDDSDYYVVIVAGRYGSIGPEKTSYTEMEYDYAVSAGKPVIGFVHEDTGLIESGKCENTEDGKAKLKEFTEKVRSRQCKGWSTADDLGGKVSRSLVQLRKRHPSPGWVPGRYAADERMLRETEQLRRRIAELEATAGEGRTGPPEGAENLAQGKETIFYSLSLPSYDEEEVEESRETKVEASWDNLLHYAGPSLVGECDDEQLYERIKLCFFHSIPREAREGVNRKGVTWDEVVVPHVYMDQITVQLQALGFMTVGTRKRTVSDRRTYWKLTPYGEAYLIKLRALPKGKGEITDEDMIDEGADTERPPENIES